MSHIKINSVVKLYTLCLLNNGPKHGYEIIKELETRMDRNISASHIYPFLKSLQDNEFICCKEIEEREKKRYCLTKSGEEFIEIVFNKLGSLINTVIEKRLTACPHCDCKIYEGGFIDIIKNKEQTFCCQHCAQAHKEKTVIIH